MKSSQVQETLDHLFRRESGKIVAYLTRFFGPSHLDLAEASVQEALLKAVQSWPLQGIPQNPSAWLLTVAKNSALDSIRGQKYLDFDSEVAERLSHSETTEMDVSFENEIEDDQLKLMFICCHPVLSPEARTALTLKTLCGFSVSEIAKAFLAKEETIAQRLVRAKNKITESHLKFEVPALTELGERLDSVLEVLYLLFNEGYSATEGEMLIRQDLCDEAIFRATLLAQHPLGQHPRVFALLALMHFQASRFQSRLDPNGELLLLEEQDRALWDKEHIQLGLGFLNHSADGDELSSYHLQAGIASCHALANSFEETDWQRILSYYDLLLMQTNSPVVALNRAVAVAMANGIDAGIAELNDLKSNQALAQYYLYPAALAELYRRKHEFSNAHKHYEKALLLVKTEPERKLIQKRIESCKR